MQYIASSLLWFLNTCDNQGELSKVQGFYTALSLCRRGCAGSKSLGAGCVWLMSHNEGLCPFVECAIRLL
jgi:hypothetical protein